MSEDEMLELVLAGDLQVTPHAIESFRIRISNVTKTKAERVIRSYLRTSVRENGRVDVQLTDRGTWVIKVMNPAYQYRFWAVVGESLETPGLLQVVTIYRPRKADGTIRLMDYYLQTDTLRREILNLEDKISRLVNTYGGKKGRERDANSVGVPGNICQLCGQRVPGVQSGVENDRPVAIQPGEDSGEGERDYSPVSQEG